MYEDYGRARDEMFEATHAKHAPWFVVDFGDQRRGRLNLIRHMLDQVSRRRGPGEAAEVAAAQGESPRRRSSRGR